MSRLKLRLLPLTILAGALLLAVQLNSLLDARSFRFAAPAHAEETRQAEPAETPAAATDSAMAPTGPASDAFADDEEDLLADFTPKEIEVLYNLVERREKLDRREAELVAREALLDAAEKRMQAHILELQELRTSIEALVREYDEQERAELESVVKIYEAMKPKDAAAILEKLEMPVLLSIAEAMKERRLSAILADMAPDRAREITAEMARKKAIDLSGADAARNPG